MKAIEAFEAYCDAWAQHDHVALAELFTEDGVFEASSLDAPVKGQKDLKSQLRIISVVGSSDPFDLLQVHPCLLYTSPSPRDRG